MARSFGEAFATTFNPAFRESFQFTSADIAEKKRKRQLKKASEAQLEAILAVTPKHIMEEVADSVDAPMGAERAGSWGSVSDVFSPKERTDAVIKGAGKKKFWIKQLEKAIQQLNTDTQFFVNQYDTYLTRCKAFIASRGKRLKTSKW